MKKENRGGARVGSGRKKAETKSTQIYARVTTVQKEKILEYAKSKGLNCSNFLLECIDFYIKNH